MARKKPAALSEAATKALKDFGDGLRYHEELHRKVEDRYKAWRGVLEITADAAQWTSKLHPPWVNHIVETTLAALLDERLSYRVKPRPRFYDPGEFERVKQGAKAHEALHRGQLAADRFSEKQRPFALQNAIAGWTVAKTFWRRDRRPRKYLEVVDRGPEMGLPIPFPVLREAERVATYYEGPCTEVRDVRDFFWHEAATELQKAKWLADRVWMTFEELKRLENAGFYKNVDQLKESRDFTPEVSSRETDRDNGSRTKGLIEVLEFWRLTEDGVKVITLGNRKVELKVELREERPNPFWHGEYPFVVCSTQPDLFRIPSMSQVEKIAHLQEALWDLENQTRDNVRLINNAITWFRGDVDDPDSYVFEPGARWLVEDPAQVQMWQPNPISAEIALPHIGMLKQDMQNLAGGHPFTSTSEARGVGADTATEAALVTSIAQLATKQMKVQLNYAYERVGQQRTELNKQFIREPLLAEQIGVDNQTEFMEVVPELLQGDYVFDITPMNESLMRQERRAEANGLFQVFLQAAPVYAALSQVGAARPLNADAFMDQLLDSYDIDDKERFYSAAPQPQALPGGQPGQPGQENGNGAAPMGVTAPQSIAPEVSPSNQAAIAPTTLLQRNLAMRGGAANT